MDIAHRGLYDEDMSENTIDSFDNAFNNGFNGIEFDIRLTKDKKVVIIHDPFISRVSDGVGLVKNKTYNELLEYNFGKKKIARLPLLRDVINRYQNKTMVIELKENINIQSLLNDKNNYYVSSFNYDYIKNIPKSPEYKLGVINYVFNTNIDLNKIDFIMILADLITDKIYEFYENKKIEVILYGFHKGVHLDLADKYFKKIKCII